MAVVTVAAEQEVLAAHHNALAGWVNGTAGFGQPGKLYQFSDPAVFSVTIGNRDTTNGLIASFQYGEPGSATEVARITKQGIVGQLLGTNGLIFPLELYSTATLNAATTASAVATWDAAWTAAFGAVAAAGGGIIALRPGTYLAPTVAVTNWPDDCVILGAGMGATTLLHPGYAQAGNTNREPILFLFKTNCGVAELTLDGNRTNNNGTTTGFASVEISIDGTNCWMYHVKVDNFNHNGVGMSGTGNAVVDCRIGLTSPPSSYAVLATPSNDFGGIYGIQTGGGAVEQNLLISGTDVYGMRSAGIFIGGAHLIIADCHVYNCHRKDFPDGVGGGQLAIAPTGNAGGRSQWVTIANCHVGPTQINGLGGGIEINGCDYINIDGFTVDGTPGAGTRLAFGVVLDQGATNVSIGPGSINHCTTGLNVGATAGLPVKKFGVSNVRFASNTTAIATAATNDEFILAGLTFAGNTTNWDTSALATSNWQSYGHAIIDGTDVATHSYKAIVGSAVHTFVQGSASGFGVVIQCPGLPLSIDQVTGTSACVWLASTGSVAHGVTTIAGTNVYGSLEKQHATNGGLTVRGLADTAGTGVHLDAVAPTDNTARSTAARGYVEANAAKVNGTGVQAVGLDGNLFVVLNNNLAKFLVDAEGDIHMDSSSNTFVWDEHDDLALLEAYRVATMPEVPPDFRRLFSDDMARHAAVLAETGVLTMNDDGHHFVSVKGLLALMIDALRQTHGRVLALEGRQAALPS